MADDRDTTLLGDLIDQSFGSGPGALPTPADRLAEGRRALRRRRRLAVAATSVGVVAAVGAGVAVAGAGGGSGADRQLPAASTGSSTSPTTATTAPPPENGVVDDLAAKQRQARLDAQHSLTDSVPAAYDAMGDLVVTKGWHVAPQVAEPMGLQPPEASVGLVVTKGTETRWLFLARERVVGAQGQIPDSFGATASADSPGKSYSRFEEWLAAQVALQGGGADPASAPALVVVSTDDTLQAASGAMLVEQRPMPVVDGYSTAGDRMAEVRQDGRTWFVVVRGHAPDAEVIPVDAAVLAEPTFAALVDHVRSQAASGEGLR